MDNLSNMGKVYEGATESMKKLAETFKHEADGADRRMKVHEELIFCWRGLDWLRNCESLRDYYYWLQQDWLFFHIGRVFQEVVCVQLASKKVLVM